MHQNSFIRKAGGLTPCMAIGAAAMSSKAVTPNHVHQDDEPVQKLWLKHKKGVFQCEANNSAEFMAHGGVPL